MIAWFARNGVAANLLMLVIMLAGGLALFTVKRELFPEFSLDTVVVRVPFLGASPEEVEELVVIRIEEALQGLSGIKEMTSTASEGVGSVAVTVNKGYSVAKLKDEIKTRVDAIPSFPVNTERPIIEEILIQKDVLRVSVFGNASERDIKRIATRVRDELVELPEISQAVVQGARSYELSINVSENALRRYNLTFDQVVEAVRANSLDLPAGAIKSEGGEILLRTKEQAYDAQDFSSIVLLATPDGGKVYLSQVAEIDDSFADEDVATTYNDQPAAIVLIREVGNEDPLKISKAAHRYLETARQSWLPEGVQLEIWSDASFYLQGRIDMLLTNGAMGFALVLVTLAVFLRPSLAFFVAIGIPASFLATLALAPLLGISINMLSLFAFILVLGIVVDDAIVVGESVFTEFQKSGPGVESAIRGTTLVSTPVTFAVLTTIVAFVPIIFLPGTMGKFMGVIPIVIIPTLLFSLVQSKLILPYHLSLCHVGDRKGRSQLNPFSRFQRSIADGLERFIEKAYRPALARAIAWRYYTVAGFFLVLALSAALVVSGVIRFVLFPSVPSDYIIATVEMVEGTPAAQTAAAVERVDSALERIRREDTQAGRSDPVKGKAILLGSGGTPGGPGAGGSSSSGGNVGSLILELSKSELRDSNAEDIATRWRSLVGEIPGAKRLTFVAQASGPVGLPVNVRLTGRDFSALKAASLEIQDKLRQVQGFLDIRDTYSQGKSEIKISLKDNARSLGLNASDLARQIRNAFYGAEVQRIQRDREDVKIMVRYPKNERSSLGYLEQMRIVAPNGARIPIAEVADIEVDTGYPTITRVDRKRVVSIEADADKEALTSDEINRIVYQDIVPAVLQGYPSVNVARAGEAKDLAEIVPVAIVSFVMVIVTVYALLAVPFKSYLQPFIVISVIPFGVAGAILGHLYNFQDLSILSFLGITAMAGVAVNDSLVLVERINSLRAGGLSLADAVATGGRQRFRAILLTSLTTFVGLAPILRETSLQAQFLIPMATSMAFGVLFATVVTLFLVPAVYLILEDIKWVARLWWRGLLRRP